MSTKQWFGGVEEEFQNRSRSTRTKNNIRLLTVTNICGHTKTNKKCNVWTRNNRETERNKFGLHSKMGAVTCKRSATKLL